MMKALLLLVGLLFSASASAAGHLSNGKVVSVRVDQSGQAMVTFNVAVGGTPPGCVHAAYTRSFAFDTNTAGGKSILAVVLHARAIDATLTVIGTGACAVYGNGWVEDWNYAESY